MTYHNNENFEHLEQPSSSLKYITVNTKSEKIKILYKHLPLSIIASFVCSSLVFFVVYHPFSIFKNSWYTAVIVISALRFSFILIHKNTQQHPKIHHILFILGVVFSASCWGIIGSLLMPENNIMQQMIVITIIAGVSAGAMQTLQADLTSAILFLASSILPLSIWIFMQGIEYYTLGIAIILYICFCAISAFKGNQLINQVLQLNFKNLDLVTRLYTSNDLLTIKNGQLERQKHDMNIINHMNERLQQCKNSIEAYLVIKTAAEKLFVDFYGGLTITDTFGNQDLVTQWGDKQTLHVKFSSNACWGLRTGNKYNVVEKAQIDSFCKHYISSAEGTYCIPLIVDNESIGMINFNFSKQITITDYIMQIMTVFGDAIKLALANIQLHEKLQLEATHDPLTNLFNRRYLNETLTREFYRIVREKTSLCLVMLDLDNFKTLNDTYGHEAGDEVLKFIGVLLMNHVRGSDIACRFGGEEFVLVFNNTSIDKIMPRLEHIREEIEKAQIYFHNEVLQQVTVSIGVAQAPQQGTTINDIIRAADMALYTAKKAGRNKIITTQSGFSPKNNNPQP
jgi:diguanylate cyclase (GGDEF)-like protein